MSQCSRVLEVLRDHQPHSIVEIHERAGTMRLNSRISDLRRMGYDIAYYRKNGLHTYELLRTAREGYRANDGTSAAGIPRGLSSESPSAPAPGAAPSLPRAERPAQLSVFEAAA